MYNEHITCLDFMGCHDTWKYNCIPAEKFYMKISQITVCFYVYTHLISVSSHPPTLNSHFSLTPHVSVHCKGLQWTKHIHTKYSVYEH